MKNGSIARPVSQDSVQLDLPDPPWGAIRGAPETFAHAAAGGIAAERGLAIRKTSTSAEIGRRATLVIHDARSLRSIADLWDSLRGGLDSPMLSFAWSQTALETVCRDEDLHVVMHRAGASAALAPLVREKGMLSVLRMLGVERLGEPMDFLYTDGAAIAALAEGLREMGNPLCLEHLLDDSQVIGALRQAYRGHAFIRIDPMNASPYIPLHDGWTEPEKMFNAGRRSDFRRAQRRAEKLGKVSYEVLAPTPDQIGALLSEAYRVEANSWKGRAGTDLLTDAPMGDFFRRVALCFSERGTLRMCFMRIDGQAVAVQLAVEHGSRFWLLKIGYDDRYAGCSPGNLLMLRSVQYAAQRGLDACEFLGSQEAWTKVWSKLMRQRVKIRIYPYNIRGAVYFTSDAGKFVWKRFIGLTSRIGQVRAVRE